MTILRLVCAVTVVSGALYAQPLDSILVLDTSPGTEQALGLIHPRVFRDSDRAGVIRFRRTAEVLQPLTGDHDQIEKALQRAGIRAGVGVSGVQIKSHVTGDLTAALKKACAEFGQDHSTRRRRAIVMLFGSEDLSLSAHRESLRAMLKAANARLYAVVIQRFDSVNSRLRPGMAFPVWTVQLMSELVADSGGRIFKGAWDLKEILTEARKP